ncbi:unnamed protein product [Zymoseptoria tritici ST99CH_1E4]|uniref:Up-regulated during septation protein 1 domain-containing protein n=1 Tax=Zymoseptoria tritici ST99CH_1E4 TaxID=1276532 RepID=A0A2H1G6V0_ZYMTR|nr:unnamed protein product [Zymoseptoria tritici ST99CH_1E4]
MAVVVVLSCCGLVVPRISFRCFRVATPVAISWRLLGKCENAADGTHDHPRPLPQAPIMASQHEHLSATARTVSRRCSKLSRLRREAVQVRDRISYTSKNIWNQRNHVRTAQQQLVDDMSNLVQSLATELDGNYSRELDRLQGLSHELRSNQDDLEQHIISLRADEDLLSQIEYRMEAKEERLRKASSQLVKVIKSSLRDDAEEPGGTTEDSNSVRSGMQAPTRYAFTMHPKQEEYYSRVADEGMMLERFQRVKEEYDSERASRDLLRDQGREPEMTDEDFELQARIEVLHAVEDCDRATELVEATKKECFALDLDLGTVVGLADTWDEAVVDDNAVPSDEGSSPAMSGVHLPGHISPRPDPLRQLGYSTAFGTSAEPALRQPSSSAKADQIGQWIEIIREQASDAEIDPSQQSPHQSAHSGDVETDVFSPAQSVLRSRESEALEQKIMPATEPSSLELQGAPNPQIVLQPSDTMVYSDEIAIVQQSIAAEALTLPAKMNEFFIDPAWNMSRRLSGECRETVPSPRNPAASHSHGHLSPNRPRSKSDGNVPPKPRQDSHQDQPNEQLSDHDSRAKRLSTDRVYSLPSTSLV